MKLNNTKQVMVLLLVNLLILSSCKKYINLEPKDATYDKVFWANGQNADKALSGIYGSIRNAFRMEGSYFTFGDLPADGFEVNGNFWNYQSLLKNGNFRYSYVPYLEGALLDWSRFYGIVNQCHLVIENVPGIPDAKFGQGGIAWKKQLLGEGHFLRAFTYFYMTRIWGDPVLTKESVKDPTNIQPIARSNEGEVLDYCIGDLKKAAQLMDFNTGTDNEAIRADKGAAWALLAHVYAWKKDYANAKKYCDSVINSGNYMLESADTYENIWTGQSHESIFEIFMRYDDNNNEASGNFFGIFLHDPLIKNKNPTGSYWVNTERMYELYDTTADKRFHKTIGLINTGYPALIKYANVNYYDKNQPSAYVVDNNLVLLRLADIYLLKAEAEAKTGNDGGAQLALNEVKRRAGLSDFTGAGEDLVEEILSERYRELLGEGCLAFDLIRMGKLEEYFPDAYIPERISKKGYYWPLNMRLLLPQNALLTQNEWWKNH